MGWTPPPVGTRGTWTRTFTSEDVERYATITGDRNPLHFDPDFAARTTPGRLIVHGGLTTGLFNALVTLQASRHALPDAGIDPPRRAADEQDLGSAALVQPE